MMIDFNEHYNNSYERINVDADLFFEELYNQFRGQSEELDEMFTNIDMSK